MPDEDTVIVQMRHIKLDVVIPEKAAGDFMVEFGKAFATDDECSETGMIKPVDSYYNQGDDWHIQVSVWEGKENAFYNFLGHFCATKKLPFQRPDESFRHQ